MKAHQFRFPVMEVLKVVDGDTLDLMLDLGFSIRLAQRVRLIGIDTPEIASKDAVEKERARSAREFVRAWCDRQDQIVAVTTRDEKYGRMLADLEGDGGSILTAALLEARLAKAYRP